MKRVITFLLAAASLAYAQTKSPEASTKTGGSDYRLSPRDTITFDIYNQTDMKTAQRITSTGEIRLPLIGTVNVAGATLREAELLLEALYRSDGYFVEPQVILSVEKYGERYVAVLGQVKEPSRIALAAEENSIGILQAITQAGGLTRVAKSDSVQIIRVNAKGQDERLTINMEELLQPKAPTRMQEFQLQPGDTVFVPERVF